MIAEKRKDFTFLQVKSKQYETILLKKFSLQIRSNYVYLLFDRLVFPSKFHTIL